MRVSSIQIKATRRFSALTVEDIPSTAKLVFLCGPNGAGKSSLLDGIRSYFLGQTGQPATPEYLAKRMTEAAAIKVFPPHMMQGPNGQPIAMPQSRQASTNITFHSVDAAAPLAGGTSIQVIMQPLPRNAFYFRSAHRNEAEFSSMSIGQVVPMNQNEMVGPRSIDNDAAVSRNYQRLVSDSVRTLWSAERGSTTFDQYRQERIGTVAAALRRLFPDLNFTGVGSPLGGGTFLFHKGISHDFPYRDLSGGEKAAFDLLLDVFTREVELSDTLMCIDEPEAHLNARVHGELLSILFETVSTKSQLWIASHSIGMMRRARDLARQYPEEVVFLDFENRDFDEAVTLKPVTPDRELWKRALRIALDDLGELIAPEHIVICEGENNDKSLDAACYQTIFSDTHSEAQFVPGGSNTEVQTDRRGYAYLVGLLTPGAKLTRLVDRDDKSEQEILEALPMKVLGRRNIEAYLFSDANLRRFAERRQAGSWTRIEPRVNQALADARARGYPADDRKPAKNDIYDILRQELQLHGLASSAAVLAKELLVREITPYTQEYIELKQAVFG